MRGKRDLTAAQGSAEGAESKMDEKQVQVAFGALTERYVGQSVRAGVQVDRLILHILLRFRFPLLEPGPDQKMSTETVNLTSFAKDAQAETKKFTDKLLDNLKPDYLPAKVNFDDPSIPRLTLSTVNKAVFIDTYVYITPDMETRKAATDSSHIELQAKVQKLLSSQGPIITFYTEQ
jgi:hypothetical protein